MSIYAQLRSFESFDIFNLHQDIWKSIEPGEKDQNCKWINL